MKKIFALLCALLMCLTFVLVSCGGDDGDGDQGGESQTSVIENIGGSYSFEDDTEFDNIIDGAELQ